MFGSANGGIWLQITVRKIGQGHILVALVVFQNGSWVKMNLTCEPLYGLCRVLAVTLLNIHESQRFKKGAFRFWGAFLCSD